MSKLSTVSAEEVRRRYQDFIEGKNTPEQRSQATEHYKALGRVLDTGLPRGSATRLWRSAGTSCCGESHASTA